MRPALSPRVATTLVAFAALAALSCGESTGPHVGPPASLQVVSGDAQVDTVGQELPQALVVKVLDDEGQAVPTAIVNFVVVAGGGSVFAGAAQTNAEGVAQERWTLGTSTADSQKVEVRAVDATTGQPKVFGVFRATAVAGAPATITKLRGDGQPVTVGTAASDSLTVRVADQYGNPVIGASVGWSAAAGAGTVSPATTSTGADGIAQTRWTIGTDVATPQVVTASVATLAAATFQATAVAGPASTLVLSRPASGAAAVSAFAVQPTVSLVDVHGNPDPTASATVSLTVSAGATVVGTGTASPASGVAAFSNAGLAGPVGAYTLTYAAILAGTPVTVTQPITLAAGAASRYVVTAQPQSAAVGSSVALSAQLADGSGNPVAEAGRTVTWATTGAGGTFAPAASTTSASGGATTSFTPATTFTSASAQVTASDPVGASGTTFIAVTPGAASKLVFDAQPTSTGYGITFGASVYVADQYGNAAAGGQSRAITLAVSGGSASPLEGTTTMTVTDGAMASFADLVLFGAGSGVTLTASAPGVAPATSAPFDVSAIAVLEASRLYQSPHFEMVVGGSTLYYATRAPVGPRGGAVLRTVPRTGGPEVSIDTMSGSVDHGLRAHGDRVDVLTIFSGAGGQWAWIRRFPIGGGAISTLDFRPDGADNCGGTADLEFDGTYFYISCRPFWQSAPLPLQIVRVRANDGAVVTLATPNTFGPIAVRGGYLYYADSSGTGASASRFIKRVRTDGSDGPGGGTTVATGIGPVTRGYRGMLVLDDATVVWAETGTVAGSGRIATAPGTGGTPTARASGLSPAVHQLMRDGDGILFNDGGTVKRISLADWSVTTVLAGQNVEQYTFDDRSLYFLSGGDAVTSVKKTRK